MAVQPLDILIAYKAINLSADLSNSEKRVAGVLLDHFNRKTGQCDPGQTAVADLIGISRRTVIRSVERLERLGLFRKVKHGGKFHRNQYEPVWSSFRKLDAAWTVRRKVRKQARVVSTVSPCQRQSCHLDGDTRATQTYLSNQSEETCGDAAARHDRETPNVQQRSKGPSKVAKRTATQPIADERFHVKATRARDVHQDVAERRWNADLMRRYAGDVDAHVKILSVIDEDVKRAATQAEMARAGGGLALIIERLAGVERSGRAP